MGEISSLFLRTVINLIFGQIFEIEFFRYSESLYSTLSNDQISGRNLNYLKNKRRFKFCSKRHIPSSDFTKRPKPLFLHYSSLLNGARPDLDMGERCAYALSDFTNRSISWFRTLKNMRLLRVILRSDLNPLFFIKTISF